MSSINLLIYITLKEFMKIPLYDFRHPSHWGKLCFLSTPDGENCGLVKNIAATGLVSSNIMKEEYLLLLDTMVNCGMEKLVNDTSTSLSGKDKILVDGEWVGVCVNSLSFVQELRKKRQRRRLPSQVPCHISS